jgi:AhpD family alkylhydroperoxidase
MATYAASIPVIDHAKRTLAAMVRLSETSSDSAKAAGIEPEILEFVKYRASLLNGCSYCIHMHAHDARELGVSEERLVAASAWEDSDLFGARERAALALTDAATRQGAAGGIDPAAIQTASDVFGEEAASHLVFATAVINAWNRIGVAAAMQADPAWGAAPATL